MVLDGNFDVVGTRIDPLGALSGRYAPMPTRTGSLCRKRQRIAPLVCLIIGLIVRLVERRMVKNEIELAACLARIAASAP